MEAFQKAHHVRGTHTTTREIKQGNTVMNISLQRDIGVTFVSNLKGDGVEYSFSLCSPNERHFCKKSGVQVALAKESHMTRLVGVRPTRATIFWSMVVHSIANGLIPRMYFVMLMDHAAALFDQEKV